MISIVDYDAGNLHSVYKALKHVGAKIECTSDFDVYKKSKGIVLPGVGAFGAAIKSLRKRNTIEPLKKAITDGIPLLGICLGYQLLFTTSEEPDIYGNTYQGLNILDGKVLKFKVSDKIPHMGWNEVHKSRNTPLFNNICENSYFYFVHSYYVIPSDREVICGETLYGKEFASAIAFNNIYGVQFHPEKSGDSGLQLLSNFVNEICS